jgi:hypothetical protein
LVATTFTNDRFHTRQLPAHEPNVVRDRDAVESRLNSAAEAIDADHLGTSRFQFALTPWRSRVIRTVGLLCWLKKVKPTNVNPATR